MMKKIKNTAHLREETMKLRIQELELEKTLRQDWADIRENINPQTMLKKKMADREDGHWLLNSLGIASSLLSRKFLGKAEANIENRVEKKIKFLGNRIGSFFQKRK